MNRVQNKEKCWIQSCECNLGFRKEVPINILIGPNKYLLDH